MILRIIAIYFYTIFMLRKSNDLLDFLDKRACLSRYTGGKIGGRYARLTMEPTLFSKYKRTYCHAAAALQPYCGRTGTGTQPDG